MKPQKAIKAAQKGFYSKKLSEGQTEQYEAEVVALGYIREEDEGTIVDIGCGHGELLLKLQGNWRKIGLDLYPPKGKGFESKLADVSDGIPLDDESADVISAQMLIEHLVDTDAFLAECNRILKKGGALVLSTCNLAHPRVWARLILGKQPTIVSYSLYDGCRHTRYYTFASLKDHLSRHGFEVEKRHGAIGFRRLTNWMPKKIRISLFGMLPQLGGEIVVKARKTGRAGSGDSKKNRKSSVMKGASR